ncbi:DUF2510 domain-containing protein [Buchananella hordeovulneris]|uniref:DUF2510 domain-containing protein n=1 Tax=Buchananella hordeovulneris TaxID=52770 RepID=UPI0026DC2312|nr:DUF2510 domain-containing protein [Buchananella hordeovulneris]MDO5080610.1 DUF2510 domain-containing protein [Buchananella hordeovulneris]
MKIRPLALGACLALLLAFVFELIGLSNGFSFWLFLHTFVVTIAPIALIGIALLRDGNWMRAGLWAAAIGGLAEFSFLLSITSSFFGGAPVTLTLAWIVLLIAAALAIAELALLKYFNITPSPIIMGNGKQAELTALNNALAQGASQVGGLAQQGVGQAQQMFGQQAQAQAAWQQGAGVPGQYGHGAAPQPQFGQQPAQSAQPAQPAASGGGLAGAVSRGFGGFGALKDAASGMVDSVKEAVGADEAEVSLEPNMVYDDVTAKLAEGESLSDQLGELKDAVSDAKEQVSDLQQAASEVKGQAQEQSAQQAQEQLAQAQQGSPTGIAAGWYADPQNPAMVRYWDGNAWTSHVQPRPN